MAEALFEGTFGVARDTARGSALAREMPTTCPSHGRNGDVHAYGFDRTNKITNPLYGEPRNAPSRNYNSSSISTSGNAMSQSAHLPLTFFRCGYQRDAIHWYTQSATQVFVLGSTQLRQVLVH